MTMKKFITALILALACNYSFAATQPAYKQFTKLLTSVATTSTGDSYVFPQAVSLRSHQAVLEGASALGATVVVQGSNDGVKWVTLGTITLTASVLNDGFISQAPWIFERGQITALSGTGAAVTLTVGD
jgi:hypothetical protein